MLRPRSLLAASIAWPVVSLLTIGPAAQQEKPTFRAGVTTVDIYATVRGSDGAFVPDLTREDFEIKDDGVRREVAVFSREIVPITVTMMMDMSGSQEVGGEWMREAGHVLVDALLPADRARIGTFGHEIAISPRLTGDQAYLHRVLAEEIWPGGATPLWQALDRAMTSLANESGRRVILVLTDGVNTQGVGYGRLVARSIREGFMVYAVGRGLRVGSGLSIDMRNLATDSGGGYRVFPFGREPKGAMLQVVDELHRQYLLGFTPAAFDGKVHKLEVKTKRGGTTVQARKSYLAAQ
jgi:VWFA-related protein